MESFRLRSAVLLFVSVPVLTAQSQAPDVMAGQRLFERSCTACHGGNGKGGRAPDLTSGQWRRGGSDADILRNILSGIPNTEMPAFPMRASDGEQIVAYLRSLASGGAVEAPKGDSAAGRAL